MYEASIQFISMTPDGEILFMDSVFETHRGQTATQAISSLSKQVLKNIQDQLPWAGLRVTGMSEDEVTDEGLNLVHIIDSSTKETVLDSWAVIAVGEV